MLPLHPTEKADMRITVKAPLRMSFAGGGTDLPTYYETHGGAVLSSTIQRYARAAITPRDDGRVRVCAEHSGLAAFLPDDSSTSLSGGLELARAAVNRVFDDAPPPRGFDLAFSSEAPQGSGLGGSSALLAAILGAVHAFSGRVPARAALAEEVFALERETLGVACGRQDMYAVVFGGFNVLSFDADGVSVTPIALGHDKVALLEHHLLLCFTGKTRRSSALIAAQETYVQEGRRATVQAMAKLQDAVFPMRDALLDGQFLDFADALHAAWEQKRRMNPFVSDPDIDALYATARREGSLGGKLLGAGGGGYLLLFVPPAVRAAVAAALTDKGGEVSGVTFDAEGLQIERKPYSKFGMSRSHR